MQDGSVHVSGGGGYPPGGGSPPGGGWGPPPGGSPPGGPPGGGWGPPPGGPPPGNPPPGYGPPGGPGGPGPGAPGIPGGPTPPQGPPPGYGPPGGPPGGLPPGYVPPGAPPPGAPGYGPPQGPPGGLPPGYVPPGQQPPPPGGGYGPPGGGGAPGGGYAPPGYGPPGYGPPAGAPGGGGGGGYPPAPGYAPPAFGGGYGPPGAQAPGGGQNWSPTEAISFGWNALMKNFAGVSLPIAVAMFIAVAPGQILTIVYQAMASMVAEVFEPSFIPMLGLAVQFSATLLGLVIGSFIAGGVVSFSLKVARGQQPAFGEVFSGGKYFGSMLLAAICAYIGTLIGALFCVVPGVILAIGLSMYTFLIVDEGLGGIDALKRSWELTNGHKVNLFIFGILAGLVSIAGALACGIGLLLGSYPVILVGAAYVYLHLKGEAPRLA